VVRPVSDALVDWGVNLDLSHRPNRTARRATLRKGVTERIAQLPAKTNRMEVAQARAHWNILRMLRIKLRLSCQGYRDLMAITRTMRRELLMFEDRRVIVGTTGPMFAAPKVSRHDSRLDDQLAVEVGRQRCQSHLELRSAYSRSAIFLTELASKLKIRVPDTLQFSSILQFLRFWRLGKSISCVFSTRLNIRLPRLHHSFV